MDFTTWIRLFHDRRQTPTAEPNSRQGVVSRELTASAASRCIHVGHVERPTAAIRASGILPGVNFSRAIGALALAQFGALTLAAWIELARAVQAAI